LKQVIVELSFMPSRSDKMSSLLGTITINKLFNKLELQSSSQFVSQFVKIVSLTKNPNRLIKHTLLKSVC